MVTRSKSQDHALGRRIWFFIKFLEIRLRFVLILVITALVVGYWTNIQNYIERWQRRAGGAHGGHEHAEAESEFEHFCPMHPFVVRDRSGKCPICGMDLVQRKKGTPMELPAGTLARVQVSPDRIMQAGVEVVPVVNRLLVRAVRTYGVIEPDETRLATITARFPGRIERLMVNATGMTVTKGQPLAEIYSPKFLSAAQEYVQAVRGERRTVADSGASADEKRRAAQLVQFARQRLLLAGFTEEQLNDVVAEGRSAETVTLYSPVGGVVLEKDILPGENVEEGSELYTIADLSRVWVQAYVIESELSAVRPGMAVEVTSISYPGEIFYGTVDFIYPTVNTANRSVKVRVAVDNTAGKLKPGMYVTAVMRSPIGRVETLEASSPSTASTIAAVVPGGVYSCPMHPEVVSSTPTDCPKCGMHLVRQGGGSAPDAAADAPIALPTNLQADADRFLATIAPGGEYFVCPMHPEVVSNKMDDCPKCGMHLVAKEKAETVQPGPGALRSVASATEQWVEGYSCSMHPDELSDKPGVCITCGCGMKLEKTRVELVPAIPEHAVIDTGTRRVVYVETMPGVYDSREVTLGPRAGTYYPLLDGLKVGDRIVSRGSFLIDAEARLNPSTANTAAQPAESATTAPPAQAHQHGG